MSHWSIPSTAHLEEWKTYAAVGVGTVVAANLAVKLIRKTVFVPSMTIMDDVPNAGKDRPDGKLKGRAVVCGGSIAGLLAAAVCAHHFDSVLVIEAEGSIEELGIDFPKERETRIMENGLATAIPPRKRVPQYLALHGFLPTFLHSLRQLFPQVHKEMEYFGIYAYPMIIKFYQGSILSPEIFERDDPTAPKTLPISREAFETLLRRLVVKYRSNITFITGTVEGYQGAEDGSKTVTGVRVRTAGGEKLVESADFVIDATGPAHQSYHKWLKNAGFGPLPQSLRIEYDPHIVYSQSLWTIPEKLLPEVEAVLPYGSQPGFFYVNSPDWAVGQQMAMYMGLMEGSQLIVSAAGWGVTAEQLPHSIQEFRAYAQTLHQSKTPDWINKLFDILETHEEECRPWWVEPPSGRMSFVKYHEAPKGTLPDNWVAVGDAISKLNPVYGQGCTKAMMDAITLDALLRHVPSNQVISSGFSGKFFHKSIARSGGMWDGTKSADYGWPTTEPSNGEKLSEGAFGRHFSRHLLIAGRKSRRILLAWQLTIWGFVPSTDLFAPSILGRVAWNWLTN
ncbi:hypothetical protein FRB95_004939 [Tulasnella sp. JGI-2019a]|nr:hypothetical protein FRB95_004939 [Tulasnella sp. JGI-2019a]